MRFLCIADEDTVRGFRLGGVAGTVVRSATETTAAIEAALNEPDCGVIILTNQIAEGVRPLVEHIRFDQERPLILEIPGPDGSTSNRMSLRELVQSAVGLRFNSEKGN